MDTMHCRDVEKELGALNTLRFILLLQTRELLGILNTCKCKRAMPQCSHTLLFAKGPKNIWPFANRLPAKGEDGAAKEDVERAREGRS